MQPLAGEYPDGCESYFCPSIVPLKAGDLDGDGSEDLFTSERRDGATFLHARRGIDGSTLWITRIQAPWYTFGYAFVGRVDVTGDATPEIVILEVHRPYTGLAEPLAGAASLELDQRVRLFRPADGSAVWERTFSGSARGAYAVATGAWVVQDLVVDVSTGPDATGDTYPDVLVQRATRTTSIAGPVVLTSADTLDGRTGATAGSVGFTTIGGSPTIVPSADLSGDGLADLVSVAGATLAADPIDGSSRHWARSISKLGRYPFPAPVHLHAGVLSDVAVITDRPNAGFVTAFTTFRGEDGAQMWTHQGADRDNDIDFAGDVDRDGITDLAEVGTESWFGPLPRHLIITRSGATGQILLDERFRREVPPGTSVGYAGCWHCLTDVTGDGVLDALLLAIVGDERDRFHTVRSLGDGAPLWERHDPGPYAPLLVPVNADLNGNGSSDLFAYQGSASDDWLEGRTGALIGSRRVSLDGSVAFGARIDGSTGDELVVSIHRYDEATGESSFGLEVVGAEGMLWSVAPSVSTG